MRIKLSYWLQLSLIVAVTIFMTSCGGGGAKISANAEKLMANSWKYDVNANLAKGSENVEDGTGIKSDIILEGDVGAMANFVAETLTFGKDTKDKSKLSYQKKIGEGLISTSVVGYWEMSEDDKMVIMKEWDNQAGKEKDPVKYTIAEITADQLVLVKEGETTKRIYKKK